MVVVVFNFGRKGDPKVELSLGERNREREREREKERERERDVSCSSGWVQQLRCMFWFGKALLIGWPYFQASRVEFALSFTLQAQHLSPKKLCSECERERERERERESEEPTAKTGPGCCMCVVTVWTL